MALKSRILGLVVAAGLLSACGSVQPGAAAVVNGETISMRSADEAAQTFCLINLAGQQGGGAVDNSEIRRQALTALLLVEVADQVAADRNLKYTVPKEKPAGIDEFRKALEPSVRKNFDTLISDNFRLGAIVIELGRATDPKLTDENALLELGMAELNKAMADMDVEIDPRFGLDASGQQIADSGSLSVATENLDAPAPDERAIALQCAPKS